MKGHEKRGLIEEANRGQWGWNGNQREGSYTNAFSSCSTLGLLFLGARHRGTGRPLEQSLDRGRDSTPWPSHASLNRGQGESAGSWQFLAHSPAADTITRRLLLVCALLLCLKWLHVAAELSNTPKAKVLASINLSVCCVQVSQCDVGFKDAMSRISSNLFQIPILVQSRVRG